MTVLTSGSGGWPGSRTALERQQTPRAAVGWSFTLLTGDEQLLQGRHWVLDVGADWAGSSHDGALGQPGKG